MLLFSKAISNLRKIVFFYSLFNKLESVALVKYEKNVMSNDYVREIVSEVLGRTNGLLR